ncbi:uncharacterized protein LOC100163447 isoform X1 [Acyrthosiphon pisum]|uniref:Uncharacterized protein n=1 Tax=Acyrthosiphon pisum TaxID=7029 RepID=A0A8R1X070_ACYPI|nr:uncharacterized protein LOC100163447 isoform X1 [Acyrthosiphon pisum]XP_029343247.1 uncharacterized protein LOC100163447 isoform X1 [Acyrthosiphon pisum]|eukprot:XP_008178174.1 PREDICTED: uncharacterized protein LOC100163447 isoform X1 [Acyrthosiphon pisum]
MASSSTMIVAVASALCVHTILAYPTSIERVSGDNNYLPLRNSPSRDLDRFIDTFCVEGNRCNLPSGVMAAAAWDSLDRLDGGHTMVAKRSSLDRLNGGHTMAAKRSLDRLNGGHVMVARRSSLDRLNGGHVMVARRSSLDRLNGGHIMVAKRSSLDRLNGGHVMVAKRSQPKRFNDGLTVVTGGPLSVRGQLQSAPQQLQQQPPKYPRTLTRWSEADVQYFNDNDRDDFYSKDGDDYYSKDGSDYYMKDYDGDDCQGCGSSAKAASF